MKNRKLVTSLFELEKLVTSLFFDLPPLNLETGKKRKERDKILNEKSVLEEIKTIFHNF